MKAIYPWAEMQPGDVREVTSKVSVAAVRSAAHMHAKKCEREGKPRPVFKVSFVPQETYFAVPPYTYRIERTA